MSVETFIRAMPKVELHVQLEGAVQRDTLLIIAEQNEINETLKHFNQWVGLIDKPDYNRLDDILYTTSQWMQEPDDLRHAAYELGVALAKQNVRYAEVSVFPTLFTEMGMSFENFLGAINDGRDRAFKAWGVRMNWILTIRRDQPRSADDVARWVTSTAAKKGNVVGIGLVGKESSQPAGQFERAFRSVAKKEMALAVHAGGNLGGEGVLDAVQTLQPNRVLNGWGTADAPDVINLLLERRITLGISMARALCIGQVGTYADYPLRHLVDEGIQVILGSDMPSYFKSTLTDEYLAAVEHNGLGVDEIQEIALNAVRAAQLSEDEKQTMLDEFRQEYARLRAEHLPEPAS
jgi:adenosine deaminase